MRLPCWRRELRLPADANPYYRCDLDWMVSVPNPAQLVCVDRAREALRKLNAAKGGRYIFRSDHSVSSAVSGHTCESMVKLVRQYGAYPLQPGEFDKAL